MALFSITHNVWTMVNGLWRPVTRLQPARCCTAVKCAVAPVYTLQRARASKYRFLATAPCGQPGTSSASAAPGAGPVVTQPIVLVKIGADGLDSRVPIMYDSLADMDRMALLRALKADDAFSVKLKDVSLDDCTVWLLPRVAGKKPSNEEEAAAVELEGADTVSDVLFARQGTPSRLLFLRVRLPAMSSLSAHGSPLARTTPLPSSHPLYDPIKAIRDGKVQVEDGHLIMTAADWPCATNGRLFVRKYYKPLFESVLNKCLPVPAGTDSNQMRQIVTGQPGIGKSVFGWYMIYRILTEQRGRTVLYASSQYEVSVIISPGGEPLICTIGSLPFLELKSDAASPPVLIADSLLPPVLKFPVVVVSSPGNLHRNNNKDLLNRYAKSWRYMPIPDRDELLQMRAFAFQHLDVGGVEKRMQLWGPIPRHVLANTSDFEQDQLLRDALAVPLDKLVAVARRQFAGLDSDGKDTPHRIVHERAAGQDFKLLISSPEYYARGIVGIASPPLVRHLIAAMIAAGRWNAAFLVDATVGIATLGALRGMAFEKIVLALLARGGNYVVRDLRDNSESTLSLPEGEPVVWNNIKDLATHAKTKELLVPRDRNAAGIDALFWHATLCHHSLMNATVSPTHELHAGAVSAVVHAMGWTPSSGWPLDEPGRVNKSMQIHFYWAVPQDQFEQGWRAEQAVQRGSDSRVNSSGLVMKHVKQHALCIPRQIALQAVDAVYAAHGVVLPVSPTPAALTNDAPGN